MLTMFRLLWRPHPAPERFREIKEFADAWRELDRALMPADDRLVELEAATMLLVDLRTSAPDAWPADRYVALVQLLDALRR